MFVIGNPTTIKARPKDRNPKALLWVQFNIRGGTVPLHCPPEARERWWACPDSACPRRCHLPGEKPRAGRGGRPGSRSCRRPRDKTTWWEQKKHLQSKHKAGVLFNGLGSSPFPLFMSAAGHITDLNTNFPLYWFHSCTEWVQSENSQRPENCLSCTGWCGTSTLAIFCF